uniref:Uncharacterized protein n=1 Tax=Utricularia reniformis TaxID=192314 RepID=A0A1Y0B4H1_9LAMI|nr:hypothetical protein AEK19_MT2163 [Utricularia reniformis]ART32312.1 hypothetical protein AEK19_MT2163 [Utricularia reniformis]
MQTEPARRFPGSTIKHIDSHTKPLRAYLAMDRKACRAYPTADALSRVEHIEGGSCSAITGHPICIWMLEINKSDINDPHFESIRRAKAAVVTLNIR